MKLGLTSSLKNGGLAQPLDLAGAKSLQLATERLAEQTMTDDSAGAAGAGRGADSGTDGGGGRARSRTTAPMSVPSISRTKSNETVGVANSGGASGVGPPAMARSTSQWISIERGLEQLQPLLHALWRSMPPPPDSVSQT